MTLEEMLIREAVRFTISVYNSAADRGRYDDMRYAFAPDGKMIVSGAIEFDGVEAIVAGLTAGATKRGAYEPGNFQRHNLGNSMIRVLDSNHARSAHFINVVTERGPDHSGVYLDEFERVGERFLIKKRQANVEWISEGSRFQTFPARAKVCTPAELDLELGR